MHQPISAIGLRNHRKSLTSFEYYVTWRGFTSGCERRTACGENYGL